MLLLYLVVELLLRDPRFDFFDISSMKYIAIALPILST